MVKDQKLLNRLDYMDTIVWSKCCASMKTAENFVARVH